jgi:hypothetical protein
MGLVYFVVTSASLPRLLRHSGADNCVIPAELTFFRSARGATIGSTLVAR